MSCWIIDVTGTLVAGAERKLVVVADRDVVLGDVALELVAGPAATPVLQVLARVALQQEAEHRPAILHGGLGLRLDHHPFDRRGGAGREELPLALDRHQADPAVTDDGELGVPAERGDVDARCAGGLEDGGPGLESDVVAVDVDLGHCAPVVGGSVVST